MTAFYRVSGSNGMKLPRTEDVMRGQGGIWACGQAAKHWSGRRNPGDGSLGLSRNQIGVHCTWDTLGMSLIRAIRFREPFSQCSQGFGAQGNLSKVETCKPLDHRCLLIGGMGSSKEMDPGVLGGSSNHWQVCGLPGQLQGSRSA